MNNNHFKKVFFTDFLTTELNKKGEEKKRNFKKILPKYKSPDFDFKQPWIKNKNSAMGHVVVTGKESNITVLDFDDKKLYKHACELVPDLHKYYTVQTKNGCHVYFLYDESLINSKVTKIDLQTNGLLVVGQDTLLKRYNGHSFMYSYLGGELRRMPQVLIDWACNVKKTVSSERRNYESSVNYNYEVNDDECRSILDQMVDQHRDYFTDYSKWLTFTAIMKTLNKKEMWDEYSHKYDNENYNMYENNKIWRGIKTQISINFFCKLLNIPSMKYHKEVPEDELYNDITYYEGNTKFVTQKHIKVTHEGFKNNDTVILESGTGTGKTTCVSRLFKKLQQDEDEDGTLLSIVNLKSLAKQQKITFSDEGKGIELTMYDDDKVNPAVIMASDACICINSLWKLSNCNFKNKIVYIDEIYSLCIALTDNDTLHKQRQVMNTLYRIVKTCKKLVVSDAHIHNNVMELLNVRLFDVSKTYVHYCNDYQKFKGIEATRYNDENEFYNLIQAKVTSGESFSFACDLKKKIEDWYAKLYASASIETQSKMRLYTKDTDTELEKDWEDLMVFYSPKITTGVDVNCIESSEQFIYITGQSVSSINLLQMATRTRNMEKLSYYSCARSCESQYESFEDCKKKLTEKYLVNQFGYSKEDIDDFLSNESSWHSVELVHLNLYIRNCYVLDLHKTNILYFFEQELKHCGFTLLKSKGKTARMDKAVAMVFKEKSQEIRDDKFELLVESFNDKKIILPNSLAPMKERCNLLNFKTAEEVSEYREVIEDGYVLEHFYNYNRLHKSLEHCESKVIDTINNKMIAGVEKNKWFKIKYVHTLAKLCGIEDNLFSIDEMKMPTLTDKNKKVIINIKTLYNKRDATEVDEYDIDSIKQLYKFMLDSLTKKIKLFSSVKNKSRDGDRDKSTYSLNDDVVEKYTNLITIMNNRYLMDEEEEE
jgi:hypothetical protein